MNMENQILLKLTSGQLSKKQAYRSLYPKQKLSKRKRAHFVKIRIKIPDEVGVSRFLALLFLFPVPLFFAKMILRRVKNTESYDMPFTVNEFAEMISVRGIKIDVQTKSGEKIFIKTI